MALKMDDRNSPYMPDDFCIGLDIGIYGRQFRIYDCDQWTRQFYEVSNLSSTKTKAKKEISFRTFLLYSFKWSPNCQNFCRPDLKEKVLSHEIQNPNVSEFDSLHFFIISCKADLNQNLNKNPKTPLRNHVLQFHQREMLSSYNTSRRA